ncbi:MAG: acetyl-CoA carboxyl transferase [Thiomonas sp. 20-64-5]|nr:MAG: acetyl-CoA carboxyl transferase [Thiomonas sp. 20-64-5]
MPFKVKPYVSEVTQFIQDLKHSDPQLEAKQKEGRARLWDKPQNPELAQAFKAARVPQKAYVYGSH